MSFILPSQTGQFIFLFLFVFVRKKDFRFVSFKTIQSRFYFLNFFYNKVWSATVWQRQSCVIPRFCLAFLFLKSFTDRRAGVSEFLREFLENGEIWKPAALHRKIKRWPCTVLNVFQMTRGIGVYSAAHSNIHQEEAFGNTKKTNFLMYL